MIDSPINWVGKKKRVYSEILKYIPKDMKDGVFVDVFTGSGFCFLNRPKCFETAIINDLDENIYNFWRFFMGRQKNKLIKAVKRALIIKDLEFERSGFRSEIDKIAHWVIALRSRLLSQQRSSLLFVKSKIKRVIMPLFDDILDSFENTSIFNMDAKNLIKNVLKFDDNLNHFFFLDPPYPNTEKYKVGEFTFADLDEILTLLKDQKFVCCGYYSKEIDELAKKHNLRIVGLEVYTGLRKMAKDKQIGGKEEILLVQKDDSNSLF